MLPNKNLRQPAPAHAETAVSDIVGSVLLIGITVLTTGGFSALILTFEGPQDRTHAAFDLAVYEGADGWASGDEQIRLTHLGGEALPEGDASILYSINGVRSTVSGDALGFPGGRLAIGDIWISTMAIEAADDVEVQVVSRTGGGSGLLFSSVVVASQAGGACDSDTSPPFVRTWTQTPATLDTQSTGPVVVTASLRDLCTGVDETADLHLHYRIDDGTDPPFMDAGAMTAKGGATWEGAIPEQPWAEHGGDVLQYFVSGMVDIGGNTGDSPVQAVPLAVRFDYTYVDGFKDKVGSVVDFPHAQDVEDNGLEAALDEALVSVPAGTGSGTFSGTAPVGSAALTSDDARVVLAESGASVTVSGFPVPADATGVSAIAIGFEGRKSHPGGTDPTAAVSYVLDGVATRVGEERPGSTVDEVFTANLAGNFTVEQVRTMGVRITAEDMANRALEVDHALLSLEYTTGGDVYRMDIRLEWKGVPAGTLHRIELGHRVGQDAFTVSRWNGADWDACADLLQETSRTLFTCDLLPEHFQDGSPKIRIQDLDRSGTAQASVFLDHARVGAT